MGKKAVKLFFRACMAIFTLMVLAMSIVGLLSSNVNPGDSIYVTFVGLALPVVLLIAFSLVIYWLSRKSFWFIVPLLSIAINYQFISSMFQVNVFSGTDTSSNGFKVKVATYNIHGFNQMKDDFSANHIANYITEEKVDILCMQEFAPPAMLNMEEITGVFDFLPYSSVHKDSPDEIGLAIFSRLPIKEVGKIHFESTTNGAQWADIELPDGKIIKVINAHLQTTGLSRSHRLGIREKIDVVGENFKRRAAQADILRAFIGNSKVPVLLCGDFNDTPASYVYKKTKGNLIDGFKETGSGLGSTFMHKLNMLRIDYIMYSNNFRGIRYYSESYPWSDHNPVVTELAYRD